MINLTKDNRIIFKKAFENFKKGNIEKIDFEKKSATTKNNQNNIKIKSIRIKNIKCFDDLDIKLSQKNNIFLGINGRGKTTVLQLIAIGISNITPLHSTEWSEVTKNLEKDSSLEIKFIISENKTNENEQTLEYKITQEDKVVLKYKNKKEEKDKEKLIKLIEDKFLFVAYGSSRNANKDITNFTGYDHVSTLFGINNNKETHKDLEKGEGFKQLKKIITEIFNNAEELKNRVILSSYKEGVFYFQAPTNNENEIPLKALSAGFKTSFKWILDLVIRALKKGFDINKPKEINGIVLIDEIDTHLHIKWQKTILRTLQDVFPNIQFIVTTHSPFVIQSVTNSNVYLLKLKDENVTAELLEIEEGTSSKHIITDIFKSTSIFNKDIETMFKEFHKIKEEIIKNIRPISDNDFKNIVKKLSKKGEEVSNTLTREIRQLQYILQNQEG